MKKLSSIKHLYNSLVNETVYTFSEHWFMENSKTVNTNLFPISVSIVKCRVTKATGKLLLSRKEE